MANFNVKVVGLRDLQRKARADVLFQPPFREGLEEAAKAAADIIRGGAPSGATGALRAKLTYKLQASPVPRYAVIKTTATRSSKNYRRYSYPKRLEFDPRSKHKDWMLKGLRKARGAVQHILDRTGAKIRGQWGR